ncbi:MAG: hypothetical protein M1553_01630 [Firmicutes bacterium]|nr:hypothetical protein [Bacillota bacterium]
MGTFLVALLMAFPTQTVLTRVKIWIAVPILMLVVMTGILADVIGVAVTVTEERPFHSRSAKKLAGARHALRLIRNADRVASLCNDAIGDLAGTMSGAMGAAIVFNLEKIYPDLNEALVGTIMVALISSVTVGGKAVGKMVALRESHMITQRLGEVLDWLEDRLGLDILGEGKKTGPERRDRA